LLNIVLLVHFFDSAQQFKCI